MRFSATDYIEEYEQLGEALQRHQTRRQRRASRPARADAAAVRSQLTDLNDTIMDFVPSYAAALDPLHHERQWVIESVAPFYQQDLITDVTRLVKGGKEANVYCCTANPALGMELLAAKLYRPRMLRHLKNDAIYKEGRLLRDAQGKQLKKGRRDQLALQKKTAYGQRLDFAQWIGTEFRVQEMLYEAGASVPKPIAFENTTILMEYVGDEYGPAPALNEIDLTPEEARPLFKQAMDNVALMLDHHHVHGDLSAYNILYWNGRLTLIDFPQMVEARHNPYAFDLLQRDITRICDYFARYGVAADPVRLTLDLWQPYMGSAGRVNYNGA
jgi:RIO kinase 1